MPMMLPARTSGTMPMSRSRGIAPAAELVKFYQDQLKEKGWEIQSTANMGEGSMFSAKKEGRQCTALVLKQDKETVVQLTVSQEGS